MGKEGYILAPPAIFHSTTQGNYTLLNYITIKIYYYGFYNRKRQNLCY